MMRQQLAMRDKILSSQNVVCECGSKIFNQAFVLKRISPLVTGTGKEEVAEIPVYVCAKCGKVPEVYTNNSNYKKIFGEDNQETK